MCVQLNTLYGGQKNCPKHVECYSKNKFEKLVHLIGFIIRKVTLCLVGYLLELRYEVRGTNTL